MKSNIEEHGGRQFEEIKKINEYGQEYWLARELQKVLGYSRYANFLPAIKRAKEACHVSEIPLFDHFAEVSEFVTIGCGAKRRVPSYQLSRYACYLIVMNADPRKDVIAHAQTYFAIKTRQQELIENFDELDEDQKRLAIMKIIRRHSVALTDAAYRAGVRNEFDYASFVNAGYMGLYGGLKAQDIKKRKGLTDDQDIMNYMESKELAANLFRATQTEAKLRRENIKGRENANEAHYIVGQEVRQTIERLGGTMPEDLPTPKKSLSVIEQEEERKKLKGCKKQDG